MDQDETPRDDLNRAFRAALEQYRAAADALAAGAMTSMVNALQALKPLVDEFATAMYRHVTHELVSHPDLAELDVQLQGFYGD